MPVEVAPTYENVVKTWWAYTWRWLACIPAIFAALFAFQFVLQFAAALAKMDPAMIKDVIKNVMRGLSFFLGVLSSLWVLRRLLTKGFGRYRLAMVEK